jgi:hypothetical protein
MLTKSSFEGANPLSLTEVAMTCFRSSVVLAMLLSVGLPGCTADAEEEELAASSNDIIGGKLDNAHPAVVAVAGDVPAGREICTGTLIAPTVIVTAAHCIVPNPGQPTPTNIRVFFGRDQLPANPEDYIPVARAIPNPAYRPNTLGSGEDAAILLLSSPVTKVKPLALNRKPMSSSMVGKSLTLVGYGNTDGVNATGSGSSASRR